MKKAQLKRIVAEAIKKVLIKLKEEKDPFVPKYGTGDVVHDCPKHVEIEEHKLKGKVLGHTLNESGAVNFIDVDFGTSQIYKNIPTSKVKILEGQSHTHEVREEPSLKEARKETRFDDRSGNKYLKVATRFSFDKAATYKKYPLMDFVIDKNWDNVSNHSFGSYPGNVSVKTAFEFQKELEKLAKAFETSVDKLKRKYK